MSKEKSKNTERILYTISNDLFPEFAVKFTHDGWWIDRSKVEKLIEAYRAEMNDIEACGYACISQNGLKYFKEIHSEFTDIREICRHELGIKAKLAIKANINKKAEWYLTMRRRKEYSTRIENTGEDGAPLHPSKNEIVFKDMSGKAEELSE